MVPTSRGRCSGAAGTTPVSELLAYNNTLQIMSTQEGVTYVDLYNAMLAEAATLLGSDGLHPTEAGYRKMVLWTHAMLTAERRRTSRSPPARKWRCLPR